MADAPTMAMALGCSRSSKASREVIIDSPSISRPGNERARAPVAMMMFCAVTHSSPSTCTRLEDISLPVPSMTVMLFLRIR